jgi:hypothetical protein
MEERDAPYRPAGGARGRGVLLSHLRMTWKEILQQSAVELDLTQAERARRTLALTRSPRLGVAPGLFSGLDARFGAPSSIRVIQMPVFTAPERMISLSDSIRSKARSRISSFRPAQNCRASLRKASTCCLGLSFPLLNRRQISSNAG